MLRRHLSSVLLGAILLQFSQARAETEHTPRAETEDSSACVELLTVPAAKIQWRTLSRGERIQVLERQIKDLAAHGFYPSLKGLKALTPEDARTLGWSLSDLQMLWHRAYVLFPDAQGSGLTKLLESMTAQSGLVLPDPISRTPSKSSAAEKPDPPDQLLPEGFSLSYRDYGKLMPANKIAIARRIVAALVEAGQLKSVDDINRVKPSHLLASGLAIDFQIIKILRASMATLMPSRVIDGRRLGGLAQLMFERGLPLERILNLTAPSAERAEEPFRPLISDREMTRKSKSERAEWRRTYREECQTIARKLRDLDPAFSFEPGALNDIARAPDLARVGLSPTLVETLPKRAGLGFIDALKGSDRNTVGYRRLLDILNIKLSPEGLLEVTQTRRLAPGSYAPQPALQVKATVLNNVVPTPTAKQTQLIHLYRTLEAEDVPLSVKSLGQLSADRLAEMGFERSGRELIEDIRRAFAGGWREWVTRAGGDAEEILAK